MPPPSLCGQPGNFCVSSTDLHSDELTLTLEHLDDVGLTKGQQTHICSVQSMPPPSFRAPGLPWLAGESHDRRRNLVDVYSNELTPTLSPRQDVFTPQSR
jgi:hypothetical protein